MKIINLTQEKPTSINYHTSFMFSLEHLKEIWLFNCNEGCQHELGKQKIKITQISKIIITSLNIENISGLLGLLSSLSLIKRSKELNIYSPQGLEKFIRFGKKYSQTNFRYNLYFYPLATGLIINHRLYQLYAFVNRQQFDFLILSQEAFGKFKLLKAKNFYLVEGPLYRKLKYGTNVLLPDGLILSGDNFTYKNISGHMISFISTNYHRRTVVEISKQSIILQCFL